MRPARIAAALVGVTLTLGTGAASAAPVSFTPLPGVAVLHATAQGPRGPSNGDPSVVEIGRLDNDARLDAASFGSGLRALVAPADPLASPFAKTSLARLLRGGQLAIVDADDDGDRDIVTVGSIELEDVARRRLRRVRGARRRQPARQHLRRRREVQRGRLSGPRARHRRGPRAGAGHGGRATSRGPGHHRGHRQPGADRPGRGGHGRRRRSGRRSARGPASSASCATTAAAPSPRWRPPGSPARPPR